MIKPRLPIQIIRNAQFQSKKVSIVLEDWGFFRIFVPVIDKP